MSELVNSADLSAQEATLKGLVAEILADAKRQGASAAEVSVSQDEGLSVAVRDGELETVEFNQDRGFGITVYVGKQRGSASTSDSSHAAISDTVRAALDIARHTQEDLDKYLAVFDDMIAIIMGQKQG